MTVGPYPSECSAPWRPPPPQRTGVEAAGRRIKHAQLPRHVSFFVYLQALPCHAMSLQGPHIAALGRCPTQAGQPSRHNSTAKLIIAIHLACHYAVPFSVISCPFMSFPVISCHSPGRIIGPGSESTKEPVTPSFRLGRYLESGHNEGGDRRGGKGRSNKIMKPAEGKAERLVQVDGPWRPISRQEQGPLQPNAERMMA